MKTKIDSVLNHINLNKLSRREKIIVAAGGGVLVLFALIQLLIVPIFEHRAQLRRSVQAKATILAHMHQLQSEVAEIKSRSRQRKADSGNGRKTSPSSRSWTSWPGRPGSKSG